MCNQGFDTFGFVFCDLHGRNPANRDHQAETKEKQPDAFNLYYASGGFGPSYIVDELFILTPGLSVSGYTLWVRRSGWG